MARPTAAVITMTGGGGIRPSTVMCLVIVATTQATPARRPFFPGMATVDEYIIAMPNMTCK